MSRTLARDRDAPGVLDRTIIRRAAKQRSQVGLLGGEETVAQLIVRGEPHPMTGPT